MVSDETKRGMVIDLGLGLLRMKLFAHGRSMAHAPTHHAVATAQATSLLPASVVKLLTQVHLVVSWPDSDVQFSHIYLQPGTDDPDTIRVRITLQQEDPRLPWLRKFFDELCEPPTRLQPDHERGAEYLFFTLSGEQVRRMRGVA